MNTGASITIFMSWTPKKVHKRVPAPLQLPVVPASLELLHHCSNSTSSQQQQEEPEPDVEIISFVPACRFSHEAIWQKDRTTK